MLSKKYIYFVLIALCFLLYANSLNNVFISDDIPAIVKNPLVSQPLRCWLDPASLLNSFNYLMGGYNPFIYHLTNIILHALNTLLVFFFLSLFFKAESSFLGACLFAVHPIHAEAVTWISGRPYTITSVFILIAYLLYYHSTTLNPVRNTKAIIGEGKISNGVKNNRRINLARYLLCLLIFSYYIIANISFYFIFPFFLILSDITFNRWRKTWKYWLPFLGILVLRFSLLINAISERISYVAKEMGGDVIRTNPIFNLTYSFFSHMGLLLWPARLTLYHEPAVISSFALKVGIISLVLLIISLPFIFKKAKELFFGIGIFVLFLAPTYSPVMVSWLVAERYLYFPSIILSIFLAFFYERMKMGPELFFSGPIFKKNNSDPIFTSHKGQAKFKKLFAESGLALVIFTMGSLAVRTVARNEDWKTAERFWRQTVLVSYNSPRAHNNLGDAYAQEGNLEGAIREFKKAIELKPDYADGYHNLANTYHHKGDLKEAVEFYRRAVSSNPGLFESHYNLGIIYLNAGELGLAKDHLNKALELRPDDINARTALDLAIEKQKN